jgi:hypothetical protein
MIKLLYKPTGNIFTLPDAEAISIKNNDRGNDYIILEPGLQKESVETVTKEEAEKIVKQKEEQIKADIEAEKPKPVEPKVVKPTGVRKHFDADINKMEKKDLDVLAAKLGIAYPKGIKKAELIAKIKEMTGEK